MNQLDHYEKQLQAAKARLSFVQLFERRLKELKRLHQLSRTRLFGLKMSCHDEIEMWKVKVEQERERLG